MKLALICCLVILNCIEPSQSRAQQQKISLKDSKPGEFIDITSTSGIKWPARALAQGFDNLIDTMGGGGGFIDYNGDGLLDIYLICYTQAPQSDRSFKLKDALYRNNGDGTFTDVTDSAGISNSMRGMGMTVGDYDNDGWPDLYITGYSESKLYHNNGNGTFTDVTARAGVADKWWGASAAFFDYDNDGYLDLFVSNYLQVPTGANIPCNLIEGKPFCHISRFKGSPSLLFHNNHDGTFTDVSQKSGIASESGKGLGVIALDYNNDGWMDIFQANDASPNFLFRNNGNGTFTELALSAQVALDTDGNARGGMGVDAEDVDQDGFLDIFVANFSGQTNAFFHNDGGEGFTETTMELGLGKISLPMSGFGARFLDYNNDGLVDIFVLNGHPFEPVQKIFPETTYAEPPFLFENTGKDFRDVAAQHGMALRKNYPGRGLAVGDIDNDGDSDLLLINVGEPPALLRNDGGNSNHWLGIRLVGTKSNRDGIGAKVTIQAGPLRRWKQLLGGTSYFTASDKRLLFGLGPNENVDTVQIKWPSGQTDSIRNIKGNQYIVVKEGAGIVTKP
jgi:hypothetical protein